MAFLAINGLGQPPRLRASELAETGIKIKVVPLSFNMTVYCLTDHFGVILRQRQLTKTPRIRYCAPIGA